MARSTDGAVAGQRMALDALVSRVRDPVFASRYRRQLSLRETSAHVNPVMLAVSTRNSLYVRSWREHARRCTSCAELFGYFDLEL